MQSKNYHPVAFEIVRCCCVPDDFIWIRSVATFFGIIGKNKRHWKEDAEEDVNNNQSIPAISELQTYESSFITNNTATDGSFAASTAVSSAVSTNVSATDDELISILLENHKKWKIKRRNGLPWAFYYSARFDKNKRGLKVEILQCSICERSGNVKEITGWQFWSVTSCWWHEIVYLQCNS